MKSEVLGVVLFKALKVALFVGSVLVVINQYEALFGDQDFSWLPALLTYCVPFCVFLAGQLSGRRTHVAQKFRPRLLSRPHVHREPHCLRRRAGVFGPL